MGERERWATRIGLILAMAGNAVGLGNFLRFPVQAAKNGGGAFMIPYFISFLLLGIPLMWVEWGIGRLGGKKGHGTTPGMFNLLWRHPIAKYLGVIGVVGPLLIVIYYAYIESWTLAFSFFSLFGKLPKVTETGSVEVFLSPFKSFLDGFVGFNSDSPVFWSPSLAAYLFFVITLFINVWILARGISKGIEILAKIAMPTLFIFAIILAVRVFTLGSPVSPEFSSIEGLDFLWKPRFDQLSDWKIWLAAAGQIFFTLSVGMGAIHTYASYLREKDDIVISGLATASTNEFAEVILGASIAIPAAVAFFGLEAAQSIAKGGAFNLGFVSMPAVLTQMPLGSIFGFLWFALLFFAGITSSVALTQPAIAFFSDEFGFKREKVAYSVGAFIFFAAHIPIFIKGALDEMDFWMGTFFITLFALIEIILFFWIFRADKAFLEIHKGAQTRVPTVFYFIMKYITPLMLMGIIGGWLLTEWLPLMLKFSGTVLFTRIFILLMFVVGCLLVHKAFQRYRGGEE
jgi:SNF family Na+-dependent transporter